MIVVTCSKCGGLTERFTEGDTTGRRCTGCGRVCWSQPVRKQ